VGVTKRQTPVVRWVAVLLLAFLAVSSVTACGVDGEVTVSAPSEDSDVASDADQADVDVIDDWARALAAGDVDGAARLFAIPSVAQNGLLYPIEDFDDARRFNASLPCGGELVEARDEGAFVVATFELRERPGAGTCGDGTGETATTAFVIEDGRIVEWQRVFDDGTPTPSRAT
jgi:hypothetical protein